jgi:integrase
MPGVEELPSGRFRVRWRDSAGNRYSPPGLTFPTKSAARTYGQDREAELRAGTHQDPKAGRMLLRDFADLWLESYVAEPRTVTKVKGHVDAYIKKGVGGGAPLGDMRLEAIDEMTVQAWVKRLEKVGRAPASISGYHRTLCTILNAAVKAKKIRVNEAHGVRLPKIPPGTDFYWQRDEAAAIRAQLTRPLDAAVFDLLLGTGLRWGEMAGLHLPRWQPLRKQLSVVEVLEEEKGLRLKAYPKGGRRRDLPVDQQLVDVMAAFLSEAKPIGCGLDHGRGRCPGLLFHEDGAPLSRHLWPRDVLAPAIEKAGVPSGTAHALRHTYASWLVIDGVPLRVVQVLLGHASIRTTERYSHLAPSELNDPRLLASLAKRGTVPTVAPTGQTAQA